MDFDAADVMPPRHASPGRFDERANVFYSPSSYARSEFDGFGKSTFFDASPPSGAADGNRSLWSQYGRETKKAGMRKLINICVRLCADANAQI